MELTPFWNSNWSDCLYSFPFAIIYIPLIPCFLSNLIDEEGELLGGGAQAQVFQCEHKSKKIICAVKKIAKPSKRQIEIGLDWTSTWKMEVSLMAMVSSPYVVHIYDTIEDEKYAYIVMEYCEKGDLRYYLYQRNKASKPIFEPVTFFCLFFFSCFLF
jgi:serine/threonine protein kinase